MSYADPQRGRWIPWIFVAGMLLVVAVNGVLVVAALTTFTGVTTGHAYDRGRTYNDVLQAAARQESLGWRAEVRLEGPGLSVRVLDRDGAAVPGRLDGVLQRPLEGMEVPLDFAALGGRFVAAVQPPLPGQWEARLTLRAPSGDKFDIRQRVMVP
jgi:nitrogen fixation protein FixH